MDFDYLFYLLDSNTLIFFVVVVKKNPLRGNLGKLKIDHHYYWALK